MSRHLEIAGCAPSTAINYVRALRDAQEHILKSADQLTRDDILKFLSFKRKTCSSSTLNTVVCALKYYYREVIRLLDLVVDIPNPRKSKQLGDLLNSYPVFADYAIMASWPTSIRPTLCRLPEAPLVFPKSLCRLNWIKPP